MSKQTHLYEVLIRFDEDSGALKGYHVQTITKHIDDDTGELIAAKVSGAMNIAQATSAGYSLADILPALNTEVLSQRDSAVAALSSAEAVVQEYGQQIAALTAEKAAMMEQLGVAQTQAFSLSTSLELTQTLLATAQQEIARLSALVPTE